MMFQVTLALALVAAAVAAPNPPPAYRPAYHPPAYDDAPKYTFDYAVKDDYAGLDFGHDESRDGYDTQGSYYVLLPDGRTQRVAYTVLGDAGYVADVTYEGEAKYADYHPAPSYHPAPKYHPAPSYHPAPAYHPAPYHARK